MMGGRSDLSHSLPAPYPEDARIAICAGFRRLLLRFLFCWRTNRLAERQEELHH